MNRFFKQLAVSSAASFLALSFCCADPVWAKMENGSFVSIDTQSVDSITANGITVEAVYVPYEPRVETDPSYSAQAFVSRFYHQVFGRVVDNLWEADALPHIDQGSFSETSSPKIGDILRDNNNVHWGIVKRMKGDTAVIIQQNAWDSGYTKAWINAQVKIDDPDYTFFTWDGNTLEEAASSATPNSPYTFEYQTSNIQKTNATISAKVYNPDRNHVQQVGCYIWDSDDKLIKRHVENCSRPESRFNMWYDISGELGITLTAGCNYKYQFFVLDNDTEYKGEIQNFTTAQDPAKVTDSRIPPATFVTADLRKLAELYEGTVSAEELGTAESSGTDKTSYTYGVSSFFEREGKLTLTYDEPAQADSKEIPAVSKVRWSYSYGNGSKDNLRYSLKFYHMLLSRMENLTGSPGKEEDKNESLMTCVWKDQATVTCEMVQGVPVVSVDVVGEIRTEDK